MSDPGVKPDWGVAVPGGFFHEPTHTYRNEHGYARLSATQVFAIEGLNDFSMAKPEDLAWKRDYGDAVHGATNFLVEGDLDWDTLDEAIIAPVTGIEQRLKEMDFKLEAAEEVQLVTIYGMQYGMKLDLRGTVMHRGRQRNAVIDLKTGSKFSPTWVWQLGGYLIPQERRPLGWMGIVLQVNPNGEITPHYVEDVERAKREFLTLLASATLKMNHGFVSL